MKSISAPLLLNLLSSATSFSWRGPGHGFTHSVRPTARLSTRYPEFVNKYIRIEYEIPTVYTSEEISTILTKVKEAGELRGLGVPSNDKEWPSKAEVLSKIPARLLRPNTMKSMMYAAFSTGLTLACGAIGMSTIPIRFSAFPLWLAYAAVTGTVATGCWVVAHECGHGAFSDNKVFGGADL